MIERSSSLGEIWSHEVYPRLTAEMIFTHEAHRFQRTPDKWKGGSPFRQSKTGTSFVVDPRTLLWYDSGMHFGGGPLQYLHRLKGGDGHVRGADFVELVKELAAQVGVTIPDREQTEEEKRRLEEWELRRAVLGARSRYAQEMLWSEAGENARRYLVGKRGFTEAELHELGFGYYASVDGFRQALQREGFNLQDQAVKSLLWRKGEGYCIIPWADEYGRALTDYGRWPGDPPRKKDHPGWRYERDQNYAGWEALSEEQKARDPWEEPHLPKTNAMPGGSSKASPLYFDRARRARHQDLVLVEGVLDAAMAQVRGDTRVIACVAAQFSKEQAAALARHRIQSVTICLDPDSAGDKGICSCIGSLDEVGITAYVAPRLPDGMDPDEFIAQRGIEAWREHLEGRIHAYRYQARTIVQKHKPGEGWTDPALTAVLQEARQYAAGITDPAKQPELERFFWSEIAEATDLDPETFKREKEQAEATPTLPQRDGPYSRRGGRIWYDKPVRGGSVTVPLSSFDMWITREEIHDNGAERNTWLALAGCLPSGRILPTVSVSAERFGGMSWVMPAWGNKAVVGAGMGTKDALREATQLLSGEPPSTVVYEHTGWREIDGCLCYLLPGGSLGPNGPVSDVEVSLGETRLSQYGLPPPPAGEALHQAVRASLSLIDLARDAVTYPLLATIYRAPLIYAFAVDFSVFYVGPTGSQKSELTAMAQAHYGAGFHAKGLPGNWSSSANQLEKQAFILKDAPFTVDDLAPGGTAADTQRFHRDAARLFRAAGNLAGRGRMRSDTTSRPEYYPRGLILASGEDIPLGHSVRSRLVIDEVMKGDVNLDLLTTAQAQAQAGVFAGAMAGYIVWLAPQIDALREKLATRHAELRAELRKQGTDHDRTPDNHANLMLGLEWFLGFAQAVGAITEAEATAHRRRGWQAFQALAKIQSGHHQSEEPTARFLSLLSAVIASGAGHVANSEDNDVPEDGCLWGWREVPVGSGEYARTEYRPQGSCIGWLSGDDLYLEPDAAYGAVQRLAHQQGTTLPVQQQTLWKRMDERKLLASKDEDRLKARVTIAGTRKRVIHLHVDTLSGESGPTGPSGPDEPEEAAPQAQERPTSAAHFSEPAARTGPEKWASNGAFMPREEVAGPDGPLGPVSGDREAVESNGVPEDPHTEEKQPVPAGREVFDL
jgi:Toprim domain-containing protein